jgi:NADH-quinone oxidoreductase subunit L
MTPIDLLPMVPALPLVGVVLLILCGRRLPDRLAAWLATGLVGAAFLLGVGIAIDYLATPPVAGADGPQDRAPVVRTLWSWIDVGQDLVEVTVSLTELATAQPISATAVASMWAPLDASGIREALPGMWDAHAVIGQVPVPLSVPAYTPLTQYNVPPGPAGFTPAVPRTQRGFSADFALQLDGLSLLMLLVVTGVGFLIHVFAIGYMAHDPGVRRFFVYMNLFVFSMLVLVLGANFLVLFLGWELVGLCSYLLIGFWYGDAANAAAGRKAFIVNRVGDFAFLIGLMLIWAVFGSLTFTNVFGAAEALLPVNSALAIAITGLLLIGATGKSAQIPLFVWLPDAMAGPTPVSALIHAATMVTAGVYMIARAHALFERAPVVMAVVAVVGTATALLAAIIACVQVDIKRVLAYSTISQLGYMFLAVGAGAYVAAIFHLIAHAFFKALLFLAAGSAIHAVGHGFDRAGKHPPPIDGVAPDQDMRQMGGLLGRVPLTGWTFVIGGLALAGLFPLAGFWSKDELLYEVLARGGSGTGLWTALYAVALLTAIVTAFYTGRQLLLVLAGDARSEGARRAEESPPLMTLPLVALALLTVLAGGLGIAFGAHASWLTGLLAPVVGGEQIAGGPAKVILALVASVATFGGLGLAWFTYGTRSVLDPARVSAAVPGLYRLAWRKFYVDEVYGALFVRPFLATADFLWHVVDDGVIDGAVNGVGRATIAVAQRSRRLQTGIVRNYLLLMLLGAVVVAAYLLLAAR